MPVYEVLGAEKKKKECETGSDYDTSLANAKEISMDAALMALCRTLVVFFHVLKYQKGSMAPLLCKDIVFLCLK